MADREVCCGASPSSDSCRLLFVNAKDACAEWARILKAVAAGEMSPAEALARIPTVEDELGVPSAYWSARDLLEQETEFGSENPVMRAHFLSVMRKLADRIEERIKP